MTESPKITAHRLLVYPTHKLETVGLTRTGTTPTESDFSLSLDELEWLLLNIPTKGTQCLLPASAGGLGAKNHPKRNVTRIHFRLETGCEGSSREV